MMSFSKVGIYITHHDFIKGKINKILRNDRMFAHFLTYGMVNSC